MLCINCNQRQRIKGRRYCRECYLQRSRIFAKLRYIKKGKHKYTITCYFCGKLYHEADRKNAKSCKQCWKQRKAFITKYHSTNWYYYQQHKDIAQRILKRKLDYNTVVHHLDHNPINNHLDNLIVISRSIHVALHNYLYDQQFRLYKQYGDEYHKYFNEKELALNFFKSKKYQPIFLDRVC